MNEAKVKRLIIAGTVGAVLLLVILLSVMVYQIIAVKVKEKNINELEIQIAEYERLIELGEDTLEVRSKRWWIERRARELGYVYTIVD